MAVSVSSSNPSKVTLLEFRDLLQKFALKSEDPVRSEAEQSLDQSESSFRYHQPPIYYGSGILTNMPFGKGKYRGSQGHESGARSGQSCRS